MRLKIAVLLVAALTGCNHTAQDLPDRGVAAVNEPMLQRADYVFEAAAPDGSLSPAEVGRLDSWFRSLTLGYGDSIYVDGAYADSARDSVNMVASAYGMAINHGAPVTAGAVVPGTVRVIVSRTRATVPGCPTWDRPSQPNYNNRAMPNFGCAVNQNLAAMVANPEDLIHGREGSGVGDTLTATKAIGAYRKAEPTGVNGLQENNTRKNK